MKVACGQPAEARRQLESMVKQSAKEFVSPWGIAQGYASLGDAGHAIEFVRKSADARESLVLYMMIDRLMDPIRGDSRFIALEKEIGLIP